MSKQRKANRGGTDCQSLFLIFLMCLVTSSITARCLRFRLSKLKACFLPSAYFGLYCISLVWFPLMAHLVFGLKIRNQAKANLSKNFLYSHLLAPQSLGGLRRIGEKRLSVYLPHHKFLDAKIFGF